MKKEYKISPERLAEYFESSRDKWKERALTYQEEKRKDGIIIRDLSRSKEKWKEKCYLLTKELNELREKEKKTKVVLKKLISQ
jgi:hypothetical protein